MSDASMSILAMTQAIGTFTTFLPPLTEVRRKSIDTPSFALDVRVGELAAAGLTIGVGAMISSLTRTSTPTVIAAITAAGMITLYELTLRATPDSALPREDVTA